VAPWLNRKVHWCAWYIALHLAGAAGMYSERCDFAEPPHSIAALKLCC
jgi:hypothetical protein